MQTPDLNKERLETLKKLFPDLFTIEGKLNPDELKKIVDPDLVKETERFEFKWFGKSEAKRNAFTPGKATLVYDKKRSVNSDLAYGNMIIEGENLETLKCLLPAYRERIKCVYIDPPYNVDGDFVYNDNWDLSKEDYWEHIGVSVNGVKIDTNAESSGRFHSNWLTMLFPRLLVSRQLLTDDGVIFVSIDEGEVHHLRKLCNEVFGEGNFISELTIIRSEGGGLAKQVVKGHDYLIVYCKDISNFKPLKRPKDIRGKIVDIEGVEYWIEEDWLRKEFGKYGTCPYDEIEKWHGIDKKQEIDEGIQSGIYTLIKKKDRITIVGRLRKVAEDGSKFYSILKHLNKNGIEDLKSVQMEEAFSFPKPVSLIKELIRGATIFTKENDEIVLDFFSGSGTTFQAVCELNQKDGGNRKCILIQLPEILDENDTDQKKAYNFCKKNNLNPIISSITIERNKRVIQKLEKEETKKQPSLFDPDKKPFKTGFKVYKLAKSNFPRVDFAPNPTKTKEENLALLDKYIQEKESAFKTLFNENDIFDEVLLKNGFMLNYSKEKTDVFSKNEVYQIKDNFKECLICMDMTIKKKTLKELEPFKEKIFICLERALDTTMKWNLKHLLGDKLIAF